MKLVKLEGQFFSHHCQTPRLLSCLLTFFLSSLQMFLKTNLSEFWTTKCVMHSKSSSGLSLFHQVRFENKHSPTYLYSEQSIVDLRTFVIDVSIKENFVLIKGSANIKLCCRKSIPLLRWNNNSRLASKLFHAFGSTSVDAVYLACA